jgi:CheY-like chemotaxis protein
MLRSSLPATIRISEDIDPHGGTVLVDPTQVHQIVMNLCTNAYHSMEDTGGTLAVSLQTTLITADDKKLSSLLSPGEYLQLTVSDTGTGIGPAIIDKIFDPYYTTKEINKGTGMGLAIVHGIMKDYGGTITVESRLGKGSIFNLYFPVLENEDLPAGKETEDTPDRGKERILFIDDEEILAEMGKAMLERLGYQVTIRRSSIEALTTFQNTPDDFDLVITDQTMPFMTGSDLARRMLQIRPDLPIILCTGYSNLVDESSAKALGIKEFALKPLTKGVIAKLVRNALAGKAET